MMQLRSLSSKAVKMCSSCVSQEFGADVLFGDWAYYCTPALSEVLKLPRVTVSNIPILDPVHTSWDRSTGRRMHAANMLAYTPQVHQPPVNLT